MFEDSLFDSAGTTEPRKAWPKVLSFVIEVFVIGILVLMPLIYTQALPGRQLMSFIEAPSPPPGRAPAPPHTRREASAPKTVSEFDDKGLRAPRVIPESIQLIHEKPAGAEGPPNLGDFVPGGIRDGVPNAVLTELTRSVPPTVPKLSLPAKLRVSSGVAEGMLVHQVKPQYPRLAIQARVQGTVVLQAVIGKDGTVQGLRVISGHPMLAPAAIEAVKQWRYRPYALNGEAVEVDTQINVNFTLGGG